MAGVVEKKGLMLNSAGAFGVSFQYSAEITACILRSGIMVAQTTPQMDEDIAEEVLGIYRGLMVDGMGISKKILPDSVQ